MQLRGDIPGTKDGEAAKTFSSLATPVRAGNIGFLPSTAGFRLAEGVFPAVLGSELDFWGLFGGSLTTWTALGFRKSQKDLRERMGGCP